jgi:hypothetical protein
MASDPANAVDSYREAFARLPEKTQIEETLLANVATVALDREATNLVERAGLALDLLVRGASAPSCDWGDTWVGDGFDKSITEDIGKGRRIARLAALRARIAIEGGRIAPGSDDAIVALTFGRHFAQGGVFIAQLVGLAMEHGAIEATAAALPRLDRTALQSLDGCFVRLPAIVDVQTTIRAEKAFFLGYYAQHNPEKVDAAKFKTLVKTLTPWYDRLIVACSDPPALEAMRAESKEDAEKAQFFDTFDGYRRARIHADVKRALFRAAIAVGVDGPGAVGRFPDPTDGKPFGLRSWATGFELTSRFSLEWKAEKPAATLIVGKRS